MEDGFDMNRVLQEYKENFFLFGLEERLGTKSLFLDGVEPGMIVPDGKKEVSEVNNLEKE